MGDRKLSVYNLRINREINTVCQVKSGLRLAVGLQGEKIFKALKDFYNYIAEFRQQGIAEFKAVGEDTKGGNDGYRQGVRPVVELEIIVDVYGYHERERHSPEYEFGDDAVGIIKIAGEVRQTAYRADDDADGKGRKGRVNGNFNQIVVHDIGYDSIGFRILCNEFMTAVGHAEDMPEDAVKIQHHQAHYGGGYQEQNCPDGRLHDLAGIETAKLFQSGQSGVLISVDHIILTIENCRWNRVVQIIYRLDGSKLEEGAESLGVGLITNRRWRM